MKGRKSRTHRDLCIKERGRGPANLSQSRRRVCRVDDLQSKFASRNLAQTSLAFHSRRTFWEYEQSEQAAQTHVGNNANWASVASEAKKSRCAAWWMETAYNESEEIEINSIN